ncbi:MAG: hypothetical protein DSY66_03125 [Persephonella sp.]|nr:MAG: hypothetical protein DSY66_03125 [Persephonella sp.]
MEQNVNLNKKNIKGFTMIELLVAIVIFSLVLIFMLQSFLLAFKINFSNEVKNTAIRLAQDELENLRNKSIDEIYDFSTNTTIYCPSPCNPNTTNNDCKIERVVKGVKLFFGKAIAVNSAEKTYLDVNLTICTDVKDWRTKNNIKYTIRTILSNIGE